MTKTDATLQITHIPLRDIVPSPMNPRKTFDETAIKELAESIAVEGVLSPIIVRPKGKNKYEIVAGERRYRASKSIDGAGSIPSIIRELTDDQVLEIMIVENLQRQDINPMEEAVGFQHLARIKKLDVREIAARVGKSASYVAQRMKLCDLIEPLQKYFYSGRMLVKDAMTISSMLPADQLSLYEDKIDESDPDMFEVNDWTLRQYQHKLLHAPFDIADPSIDPKMGSCTTCQFNTATNLLLFPEMASNPICQNASCFKAKCDRSYKVELAKAQEDPAVVLITDQYQPDKETQQIMKKVEGVLNYNQYDKVDKPELPERDWYNGNNETAQEDEDEYQQDLARYHKDLQEYQQKIESGRYIRAFIIGGSDKGHYELIKLHKTAATKNTSAVQSKNGATKVVAELEIKNEIQRIRDREKRSKELDVIKQWESVKLLFKSPYHNLKFISELPEFKGMLSPLEIKALCNAMMNKMSDDHEFIRYFQLKKNKGDLGYEVSQEDLFNMMRFFFLSVLPPGIIYNVQDKDAAIMTEIAKLYFPVQMNNLRINQEEKIFRRNLSVEKRIKALQSKLKELKKPATAARKMTLKEHQHVSTEAWAEIDKKAKSIKATKENGDKKGKGIKALIP